MPRFDSGAASSRDGADGDGPISIASAEDSAVPSSAAGSAKKRKKHKGKDKDDGEKKQKPTRRESGASKASKKARTE